MTLSESVESGLYSGTDVLINKLGLRDQAEPLEAILRRQVGLKLG